MPRQGVMVEGVKGANYDLKLPGMYKNGEKTGGFQHLLTSKSPKTPFFT
jgi:hypothetical protein